MKVLAGNVFVVKCARCLSHECFTAEDCDDNRDHLSVLWLSYWRYGMIDITMVFPQNHPTWFGTPS